MQATTVFFSYARADQAFALQLAQELRASGTELWIDQLDIPAGAQWDRAVEAALRACPRLLIVLSRASVASENVMDEASFAIEHDKKILPVLYEACDIPFRLRRLQHIDFSGDYAAAYANLLRALGAGTEAESLETSAGTSRSRDSTTKSPPSAKRPRWRRAVAGVAALAVLLGGLLGWQYANRAPRSAPAAVPISELEQQLAQANIILSEGDAGQVRAWLLGGDPAYQALAQSCLVVLENKRVIDPVPLDVVNARYMEAMGQSSDRYLAPGEYNEYRKLERAIYQTWKERHAEARQDSFDGIVAAASRSQ